MKKKIENYNKLKIANMQSPVNDIKRVQRGFNKVRCENIKIAKCFLKKVVRIKDIHQASKVKTLLVNNHQSF